jgi:DNA-binding PadR family transcriptional regulator
MLPELTSLQFAVLSVLMGSKRTGRYIREKLAEQGVRKSLAAFYQLMARLEEAGMVRGWYEKVTLDGQVIKERHYEIVAHGESCWNQTRDFYAAAARPKLGLAME